MKKILLMILTAAFLLLALAAGAEEVPVDTRIARITTNYECGCERYYYGVMIGRNGLLTKACSFYCPEHGKPYAHVHFEFGSPEPGVSVYEYDGDFYLKSYDTFRNGYNFETDIAYVRFPELIGDRTGWYRCLILKGQSNLNSARLVLRENTRDGYRETALDGFQEYNEKALKTAFTEVEAARGLPVLLLDDSGDDAVVGIVNAYTDGEDSALYIRRVTSIVRNQMYGDDMFKEGDQSCPPATNVVSRGGSAPAAAEEPAEEPQTAEEGAQPAEPSAVVAPITPGDPSMAEETAPADEPATEEEPAAAEPAEDTEPAAEPDAEPAVEEDETWTCPECGREGNTENFCPGCGTKRPAGNLWTCPECGREGNDDNFCPHCGTKRP